MPVAAGAPILDTLLVLNADRGASSINIQSVPGRPRMKSVKIEQDAVHLVDEEGTLYRLEETSPLDAVTATEMGVLLVREEDFLGDTHGFVEYPVTFEINRTTSDEMDDGEGYGPRP